MSAECWWCALQVRPSSIIDRRTALCARQTHQWREADTRRSSLLVESVNKVESRRCSVGVFDHCSTDSCNWQVVSVPSWPATTRRRKVSGPIHLAVATTANTGYVFTLFVCLFVNKVICKNYSTNFHKIRKNPLDFGGNYVSAVCVNMHRAMMMMMMMPD